MWEVGMHSSEKTPNIPMSCVFVCVCAYVYTYSPLYAYIVIKQIIGTTERNNIGD